MGKQGRFYRERDRGRETQRERQRQRYPRAHLFGDVRHPCVTHVELRYAGHRLKQHAFSLPSADCLSYTSYFKSFFLALRFGSDKESHVSSHFTVLCDGVENVRVLPRFASRSCGLTPFGQLRSGASLKVWNAKAWQGAFGTRTVFFFPVVYASTSIDHRRPAERRKTCTTASSMAQSASMCTCFGSTGDRQMRK